MATTIRPSEVRLSEVRDQLIREDPMTTEERTLVLDQVQALLDDIYVHRTRKSTMYGVNPNQQIRFLRRRLPELTGASFHYELLRLLDGLRDMHTTYVLPRPYRRFALLGIVLERYWERVPRSDGIDDYVPRFIVSKVSRAHVGDKRLKAGVEVRYWNGMPILSAVERNAEAEAGGNPAARLACGLQSMTLRSLAQSPLPVEDWVDLECRSGDQAWTSRLHWKVIDEPAEPASGAGDDRAEGRRLGLSQRTETSRRTKAQFFVQAEGPEDSSDDELSFEDVDNGDLGDEVRARIVGKGHEKYGYLRVFTFHTALPTVDQFLKGVRELLVKLPKRGLIIDVRGNGGGYIYAAEAMLQFLTGARIQPEPMQFISSDATYRLCERDPELSRWRRSLREAAETGEQYSAALPLFSVDDVNGRGRVYHGPVILVTDALCYSATDMFAAGFQDHGIGPVLGVDDNTGAGGANRWTLDDLAAAWPDGPFQSLPREAQLFVALRRSLRVRGQASRPLEDLGVVPDMAYRLTSDDLLRRNRGLIKRAIQVLDHERRSDKARRAG